jgi:hypothetical protein
MATMPDSDVKLQSLRDELRARIAALNELYHPVYPANPKRIAEYEALVADARAAIAARKAELAAVGA